MKIVRLGLLLTSAVALLTTTGVLSARAESQSHVSDRETKHAGRIGAETQEKKLESQTERQRRVPCDQVISRIDHDPDASRGRPVDMSLAAKDLNTSVLWVERCMLVYGRQPKRPGTESAEAVEDRLERLEEDEAEEIGLEDVEEPGAREEPEHPERPKVMHSYIREATPGADDRRLTR